MWLENDTVESYIMREMPLAAEQYEIVRFIYEVGRKVGKMEIPWNVVPGCTVTTGSVLNRAIAAYYKIESLEDIHDSSEGVGSYHQVCRLFSFYFRDAGLLFLTILMPVTAFVGRKIIGACCRLRSTRLGKS